MDIPDVAIVGAGLAGLAAARVLTNEGFNVVLYEAADRPGGLVTTDSEQGFLLDRGFQVLLTAYPDCREFLDYASLGLGQFERGARVHTAKGMHNVSLNPMQLIKGGGQQLFNLKDLGALMAIWWRLKNADAQTLLLEKQPRALECIQQLGFSPEFQEQFWLPFFRGILLDSSLQCPGVMVNFLLKMFGEGYAALPKNGMRAIPEQMAARLPAGVLRLNAKVQKFHEGALFFDGGESVRARSYLFATDSWNLAKLLNLKEPPKGREVFTCYFAADHSPQDRPLLVLNGSSQGYINHLAVVSDIAPSYAPAGKSLISISVLKGLHLSDTEIVRTIQAELTDWYGELVKNWHLLKIMRIVNAHPFNYPEKIGSNPFPMAVEPGLYVCGVSLESPSLQSALSTGRRVAKQIAKDLRKVASNPVPVGKCPFHPS